MGSPPPRVGSVHDVQQSSSDIHTAVPKSEEKILLPLPIRTRVCGSRHPLIESSLTLTVDLPGSMIAGRPGGSSG